MPGWNIIMHEPTERIAAVETEVEFLQEFRRDIVRRLTRLEWMTAVAIGSGLLGLVKGCGHG